MIESDRWRYGLGSGARGVGVPAVSGGRVAGGVSSRLARLALVGGSSLGSGARANRSARTCPASKMSVKRDSGNRYPGLA